MYTSLEESKVEILEVRKLKEIAPELYTLFEDLGDEIKFFGYWDNEYLTKLNKLGTDGILKGYCVVHYEEGEIIKCEWSKEGFRYSMGKVVFEKWESD
ncbi:MAG: hypothetical protein AABY15_04840 [Nanoarchaeota archaeon]